MNIDKYISWIDIPYLDKKDLVILHNFFTYISRCDKHMSEIKRQLLFLTCLSIVLKFEKDIAFDISPFRYFSNDLLPYNNISEKIIEFELIILGHINFDLNKFNPKQKMI
tara:strand:+ start:1970 stop:2299 length:330 start_codon:yes stop_codon:yes gene_type:complete